MLDLTGRWRYGHLAMLISVAHDPVRKEIFRFSVKRNEEDRFYGRGLIGGDTIIISWHSSGRLSWIGHGSAKCTEIEIDTFNRKPIEIQWTGDLLNWYKIDY